MADLIDLLFIIIKMKILTRKIIEIFMQNQGKEKNYFYSRFFSAFEMAEWVHVSVPPHPFGTQKIKKKKRTLQNWGVSLLKQNLK